MIIDKTIEKRVALTYLLFSLLAAHLCFALLPNVFNTWNEQTVDRFLAFKAKSTAFQPAYDDTIVHIDLNNSSKQALKNYNPDRGDHARVIRNLFQMDVALQLHDFIFAGPTEINNDHQIVAAARQARNVYVGMAYVLNPETSPGPATQPDAATANYLNQTDWQIDNSRGERNYYRGFYPILSFLPLSKASQGTGYLNLVPDSDGVFRRLPLLVRREAGYTPSFSLRAVCDFLKVSTDKIAILPGRIVLPDARYPGQNGTREIIIPVDRRGKMRINYIGSWDRMKHYHWSDVYLASDDQAEMDLWTDELSGKIALVSDVSTGSSDVGQVPTDPAYPLSGVHANSIHTILTQSFLREISGFKMLPVELGLLFILLILSFHPSAVIFSLSAFALAGLYFVGAGALVILADIVIPVIRPLLMIFFALVSLQIASAFYNSRTHARSERARELVEKELEIGRQIQSGFFPKNLPALPGWEFVAHFKPARQVAGDFYDVFDLQAGRLIGLVVADVCDKGVGAALFMALIRSLLRSSAEREIENCAYEPGARDRCTDLSLINTVQQAGDYIAIKHEDANMFATVFFGVLDIETGHFKYVNCGHEPPVMLRHQDTEPQLLMPTGPALGLMPNMNYSVKEVQFKTGDVFFAFTDGITDALNATEQNFSRDRLLGLVQQRFISASTMMDTVISELSRHIEDTPQFDDITMIAVRKGG